MSKLKLAILGSQRGSYVPLFIEAINKGALKAEIKLILSNKAEAGILAKAKAFGLPAYAVCPEPGEPRADFDARMVAYLKRYQVDLVVLIGYMRILSPYFINEYPRHILNVHPSLLPKYAGLMDLQVHEAVLAAGDTETGCTVHFVDEGVDTGAIVLQRRCKVLTSDTPQVLEQRVQSLELEALIQAINDCAKERCYA